MSIPGVAMGMFADPGSAMSRQDWHKSVWFPLSVILISTIVLFTLYYSMVDLEWLKDHLTQDYVEAERREMAKRFITYKMLVISSAAGILIMLPLFQALTATYLWGMARYRGIRHTYLQWFSFTAWTSLPLALMLPLGLMQIMSTANRQLGPEQLNPTTLNQLFFHVARGTPWQALLDSINVLSIWSVVLMMVGLHTWLGFTRLRSVLTVLVPYCVIFLLWALYAAYGSAP